MVVLRAEKDEGGDESPCADAGDELEFRAGAGLSPAAEETGAKCSVDAAA